MAFNRDKRRENEEQDALDNMPESMQEGPRGEAMQSALNEIERLEKQYLSLFYGIKQVSREEKTFDIVPGASKSQTVTFPCNGRTFTLEMDAETVANPENSEKGRDASVIYYRVPATVRCSLYFYNTKEEIDYLAETIASAKTEIRKTI